MVAAERPATDHPLPTPRERRRRGVGQALISNSYQPHIQINGLYLEQRRRRRRKRRRRRGLILGNI